MTPWTTLGNWFSPFSRRQVLAAAITSLNTISRAVSCDSAPFRYRQNRPVGRAQGVQAGRFRPAVKPAAAYVATAAVQFQGSRAARTRQARSSATATVAGYFVSNTCAGVGLHPLTL